MACNFMRKQEKKAREEYMKRITEIRKVPEALGMKIEQCGNVWVSQRKGREVRYSLNYSKYGQCWTIYMHCYLSRLDNHKDIAPLIEALEHEEIGTLDIDNSSEAGDKSSKYFSIMPFSPLDRNEIKVCSHIDEGSNICRKIEVGREIKEEIKYEWQCVD